MAIQQSGRERAAADPTRRPRASSDDQEAPCCCQEAAELCIDENPRSRRGHKRSKAEHNAEGLKEEELRELRVIDSAPCRHYKKRRLKELDDAEVDEIIADSQRPGWLKKDIAQKYCVSPDLVSKLCQEAAKQPEKMTARRQLKQVLAEKKEAIAAVTTAILNTGTRTGKTPRLP